MSQFEAGQNYDLNECECCGSESLIKEENVEINGPGPKLKSPEVENDSLEVYVCMVCGDNKTIERFEDEEYKVEKVTYQVSMETPLRKIQHVSKMGVNGDDVSYIVGAEEIPEAKWRIILAKRRNVLRSVVLN